VKWLTALSVLGAAVPAVAQAESWTAVTEITAASSPSCAKVAATYQFAIVGQKLTVTTPAGTPREATVAADGSVVLEYAGGAAYGTVRIAGNARTRQLELTASVAKDCRYALSTGGPAEAGTEWAVGRWDGTVYVSGTGSGTMGLRSEPRSMIIRYNASGALACNWAEPEFVTVTAAKNCRIGANTVSLVTVAGSTVDLARTAPDILTGRFQAPGWDNVASKAQAQLKRLR
jgi:hypothetical protein